MIECAARKIELLFMLRRVVVFTCLCLLPTLAFGEQGVAKIWEDYTVPAGETVSDAMVMGGTLRVDGTVNGDVAVFGGSAIINGQVKGDLAKFGGYLRLGEHSVVEGDLAQFGGQLDRSRGSIVKGEVEYEPVKAIAAAVFLGTLMISIPLGIILGLLGYAILRPRRIEVMAEAVRRDLGSVFLAGVAVLAAAIFLFVVSVKANIVHFPLRGILLLLLFVIMFVGYTGISAWLGRRMSTTSTPLVIVVLGAAVISIAQAIPIVGLFAFLIFMVLALGSAVTTGFGTALGWIRHVG